MNISFLCLFLTVPRVGLQYVIMVFPGNTYLLLKSTSCKHTVPNLIRRHNVASDQVLHCSPMSHKMDACLKCVNKLAKDSPFQNLRTQPENSRLSSSCRINGRPMCDSSRPSAYSAFCRNICIPEYTISMNESSSTDSERCNDMFYVSSKPIYNFFRDVSLRKVLLHFRQ